MRFAGFLLCRAGLPSVLCLVASFFGRRDASKAAEDFGFSGMVLPDFPDFLICAILFLGDDVRIKWIQRSGE